MTDNKKYTLYLNEPETEAAVKKANTGDEPVSLSRLLRELIRTFLKQNPRQGG